MVSEPSVRCSSRNSSDSASFSGLVLTEGVTAPADSWGRDGKDKVGIVRAVVEGREPHIRPIGLVRALYMPG